MVVKQKVIIRCFEVFMVVAIVVIAWLVMLLPIAIYFLVSERKCEHSL